METMSHSSDQQIQELFAALEAEPANREAFSALENLLTQSERWDALLKLYEREARRLQEGPARAEIYHQMALVWDERIGDPQQAMKHYQLAFRADPACGKALARARRIYRNLGNWKMVARLLELQIASEREPEARADLLSALGQVLLNEIGDSRRAAECFEQALALVPDHAVATESLSSLRSAQANWREVADAMVAEAEASTERELQESLFLRIAELFHREDRGAPEAEHYARRALEANPSSRRAAELYAQVLEEHGRYEELLEHLGRLADGARDNGERVAALCRAAQVALQTTGDEERALGYYRRVLEIDPQNPEALPAVAQALRRRRDHEALLALADQALDAGVARDLEVRLAREVGEVAWREMGDRQRAAKYLGRVRALQPRDPLVLEFFSQTTAPEAKDAKAQYAELARAVRFEADPAKRRETYRAMARLAEERLQSPKEAIDAWRSVLEADKNDEEARERLKALYRKAERWHALVELLKTHIEQLPPELVEDKVALYEEMADVYATHLKMEPMVVNTLNALLHVAPKHRATLDRLAAIYERRESWGQLAEVLARKAEATEDPRERLELLHRSAQIWLTRLQSPEDAIRRYEEILALDPTDTRALGALRKVYEQRRAYEPLVQIYLREIDVLPDPDAKLARAREVAEWAQKHLHRPPRLIELWNKVLEFDDRDPRALAALAALYERDERWQALAEVLQRQIELAADNRTRVQLLKRLGQITADRLGREELAIDLWEQALAIEPDAADVFKILRDRHLKARRFAALEQLYARSGKWEEYVDVLVVQAESNPDPAEKCETYFQIADVWEHRLGRKDRAARVLERILEIDARNVRAAAALRPFYEARGEWRKLAQVDEILAAATADPRERAARFRALAALHEEKLRRTDLAFGFLARAVVDDPAAEGVLAEVERLAQTQQAWQELASTLEAARERTDDRDLRRDLALRVARLYDERLGRVDEAIAAYEVLRADDPRNEVAIEALVRLYRETGRWEALLDALRAKLDLSPDPLVRRDLLFEIAEVEEERLGRLEAAIETYRAVLDVAADDLIALGALSRIYQATGRHGELRDVLGRMLDLAATPEQRAALLTRLGRLAMGPLADPVAAVGYFQRLLETAPEHPDAYRHLEELMRVPAARAAAAALLVDRYRARGMWEATLPAYEVLVEEAEGTARVDLLLEMGKVWEQHLRRPADAMAAYVRAFREDPSDRRTFPEVDRLAVLLDREADLVEVLAAELGRVESTELRARLTLRAATLYVDLERDREAVAAFEEALSLGLPDDEARRALRTLVQLRERAGEWEELHAALRRSLDLAETGAERKEILLRVGSLLAGELGRPLEAVAAFRDVLLIEPDNEEALGRLDRLYSDAQDWSNLADILARRIRIARGPAEEAGLRIRLAHILADHLDRNAEALQEFRTALELDPDNTEPVPAIERLVEREPDLRVLAAETLAPIYEQLGEMDKVAAALETLLPERSPEDRVEILHRVAAIAAESGNTERAFDAYLRALAEIPTHAATREHLGRLAGPLGRWPALLDVLDAHLPQITDPDSTRAALRFMADASATHLADLDRAVRYYEQVLDLDRHDEQAIAGLERLYPETGRWRELARLLAWRLEAAGDPREARDLAVRIGEVYEHRIGDADAAIDAYRKAEALFPDDAEVLDALQRLFSREGRNEDLAGVYLHRADLAQEPEDRKALLYAAAEVLEERIGDPARAVQIYRRVSDLDPRDARALKALARLYEALGDHASLLGVLDLLLEATADEGERIELRHAQGRLWQGPLGGPERAVEIYRDILADAPRHAPTLAALEGLLSSTHRVLAARVLAPVYARHGDWRAFVEATRVELEEAEDPAEKVDLWHRMAEAQEAHLYDRGAAFDSYREALRLAPNDERTLQALERLAHEQRRFEDLARIYEETLADLADPATAKRFAVKVARLWDEVLVDPEQAIEKYKRVLAYDPEDRLALGALERLYDQVRRWPELAAILRREVELAEGPIEKVSLLHRLGALLDEALDDAASAVDAFRGALAIEGEHGPTVEALESMLGRGREIPAVSALLEPLYRRSRAWEKLCRLLEIETSAMVTAGERRRAFWEIAEIQEQNLGSPSVAFGYLARALREDPTDEETLAELDRLAEVTGSWEDLAAILEEEQERASDDALRERLALRVASIHDKRLRQPREAAARYRQIVDRNPRCIPALRALDRIFGEAGAWADLARVLRLEAESASSPEQEIETLERLAVLSETKLGEIEEAVRIYREILERRPADLVALDALERIYREIDRPEDLYRIYELRLDRTAEPERRAPILAAMGALAERLGRLDDAIELWRWVLEITVHDDHALEALERLYESTERYPELCEVLARRAELPQNEGLRAALLSRQGRVYAEVLGQDEQAVESWRAVLDVAPGDRAALEALRGLYRRGRRFGELCEILEATAAVLSREGAAPAALIDVYAELGRVQGEVLMHPAAAVDAWNRVLELDPSNRDALDALERIYVSENAWRECIEVLERRIEVAPDEDERVAVLRRMADVYDRSLHLPERAAQIHERILALRPGDAVAGEALEGLYERLGNYDRLGELLLARLEAMEAGWERLALLRRLAEIYLERQSRPDLAFIILCRAVVEDPRDAELVGQVERLARETGNFEELVAVLEDLLSKVSDRDLMIALHGTLARYYAEELARPDDAVAHLRRILVLDESNRDALHALENVLRREGRLGELAEVLRRKAELAVDLHEKKAHLFDLATLCEQSLGNMAEAAAALQDLLRLDERDDVAIEALARIYRQTGHWRDLIDVLHRKIELATEPEGEIALRQQIAAIYDRELDDPTRAAEAYREILALDPGRADAREDLERILTVQRRWDDLVALLSQQIPFARGPAEEIALHEKIAAIWEEQLGHPERAVDSYRSILRIEPRHPEALEALERIYEGQQRWRDLADVLERRANAARTPEEQARHLRRLGDVYEARLADHGLAAGAYQRALEIDPDDADTLVSLASIFEVAGDYHRCAENLERAARVSRDRRRSAQIWHKVAELASERLRDPERAEGALRYAMGADATYVPAIAALKDLYVARGDWRRALDLLHREEEHTLDVARKVELLCEMGRIEAAELGDIAAAIHTYELALQQAPDSLPAARALADLYFERGEPERARALLEMVVQRAVEAGLEPREIARYRHRLAMVTEKAGDEVAALRCYQAAYDADFTYLPTLLALGDLLYRRGEWEPAFKVYQSLVLHHSESPQVDLVDVYHRLGVTRHRLGERRKAIHSFDKALEIDGRHVPTLRAMCQVYEEAGEWEEAIDVRKRLVEALTDPEQKLEAAMSIGDIYREKLKNPAKAIDAYVDALDIAPKNLAVLHKLLELYTEGRHWRRAIDVLDQIAGIETEPQNLSTYYYSVAVIYRDELKEVEPAVDYFNKALDANPMRLKAFEAIDKLLTQRRDWSALAGAYQTMLKRLDDSAPRDLRVMLHKNLGEIYRTRMKRFDEAIPHFRAASELAPEDSTLHVILAELYELDEATYPDAVRQHLQILQADPTRAASFHALYRIFRNQKEHDRAWRVAHTLKDLGQIEPSEEQYLEKLRSAAPKRPQQPLDERLWRVVSHPDRDPYLGAIFGLLINAVAPVYLVHPKDLGVRKKDRIDTTDLNIFFSKIFQLARGVLGVAPPEVFLKSQGHLGLVLMNTAPVTLLAGPDMVRDRPEPELAFALAKHLSYLRPEHFLSALLPPLVETIFYAAVRVSYPTQKLPETADRKEVEDLARRIDRALAPAGLAQLKTLLQQFFQVHQRFDADRWLASIELTGNRAGFLLCNDLGSAERVLKQEPVAISKLPRGEKIKDLLLFSVSEEYFALRKGLGLALQM